MIAKKASTVDEISGGRLILGLGAGWNKAEYEAFGFPYEHRVSRFGEALTVIRTLIREGSIDSFDGRFYSHRELELLPRARHDMTLMIGSNGPRMLRIALPYVDMWNSWFTGFDNSADGLEPLLRKVDDACADVGRDPAEVARTAVVYVQLERGTGRIAGSGERPLMTPITGSRAGIAESLTRFQATGIDHVQVVIDPIDARSVTEMGEVLSMLR
jgi:alkanesulfonate monooxygenase SsuD/methylene tetrahydromethanopterin reductase-like flavin-dependent oxidoreductase (luciferase family)